MSRDAWIVALVLFLGLMPVLAQSPSFDRIPEADKPALRKRFETEVWPFFQLRVAPGTSASAVHEQGWFAKAPRNADRDFDMMLKEGFFLPDDAGSLIVRVADTDKKRRIARTQATWNGSRIKVLRFRSRSESEAEEMRSTLSRRTVDFYSF